MGLSDYRGVIVASGTWLYGGVVKERTYVIARSYDAKWSMYDAEGWLEEGQPPAAAGPDWLYYYASTTGPFTTLSDAKTWAEDAWGPIRWDNPLRHFLVRQLGRLGLVRW
jgi:hypothetical protein